MNSAIYKGFVEHERQKPVLHHFKYPVFGFGVYLEELEKLDKKLTFFGYNRIRPFAIHDTDYLLPEKTPIKQKLLTILKQNQRDFEVTRVLLVTAPRYLNYIFNPVSFYYCYDSDNQLREVVVEVNNTFGEKHIYLPTLSPVDDKPGTISMYLAEKAFHVSPFNNMEGTYEFFFPNPDEKLAVTINLRKENEVVFKARMWGDKSQLTNLNLVKTALKNPFKAHLTMPRILWEAAKLFFIKKMPYHDVPKTNHPMTLIKRQHN